MADQFIWPRLLQARGCLCVALQDAGLYADICQCSIIHGANPDMALVTGGKGIAWVRAVTTFPSSTLPSTDSSLSYCGAPLAVDIELGVMRCEIIPSGRNPLSGAAQEAMAEMALADYAAMLDALCCVANSDADVVVGRWVPVRSGAAYGGTMTATISQVD